MKKYPFFRNVLTGMFWTTIIPINILSGLIPIYEWTMLKIIGPTVLYSISEMMIIQHFFVNTGIACLTFMIKFL